MPAPAGARPQQEQRQEERRTTYEDLGDGYLSGNLTQEPSLRFTAEGRAVCTLRVAETPRVRDAETGKWADGETEFHDVIAWGEQGQRAAEHLDKGDRIVAVGQWQKQLWTDDKGEARSKLVLTARDLGPSLLFRDVRIIRPAKGGKPE